MSGLDNVSIYVPYVVLAENRVYLSLLEVYINIEMCMNVLTFCV